jgi:hypothetical protein
MTANYIARTWGMAVAIAICSLAACYGPNDIAAPDEILLVTASPASIPADGFSTTRIIATVDARADRDLLVSFKSSGGSITAEPIAPDADGQAVALLKSAKTPQAVVVTVDAKRKEVVEASRTVAVTFATVDSSSLIRLLMSSRTLAADGRSTIELRAETNPAMGARTVAFKTTSGSFSADVIDRDEDVAPDSNGVARVLLYAPREVGTALVTVAAESFSASDTVTFTRALPDAITLIAEPLAIPANDTTSTKVTAKLSRSPGKVSEGTRVEFSIVSDVTGGTFGRFQGVLRSNENEEATADFVAGTGAPLGVATITARVPDTGDTATVKITIQ